ncbi:MAG: biotin/lipoyl-binding protein [Tepidisphaera sp.]|nr:biotin/lipoyl-binding protein [Tepidisphaera sp.]
MSTLARHNSGRREVSSFFDEVLRADPGASFSDLWYKVGPTRPTLSPHAQVIRQRLGDRAYYVVEDPAGGQFYRLSEPAYFFLGMLNGRRTVDDAWQACNAQMGDDAPTQRECVDLLSRLQLFGLLSGDLPLAPDMIEERRRDLLGRRLAQRTGRGLTPTIPLLNPEPFLEQAAHLIRPLFSAPALVLWVLLVSAAFYRVFIARDELFSQLNSLLEPGNLPLIGVVFLLLRAWHELGHACAAKAMGGRCTEIGLMFVVYLLPFPYCDTSSAWRFPEVYKRVVVSMGGVLFESVPAALCAIIWSYQDPTSAGAARAICYYTMIVSGITTLMFNLNPLLRYDGYYALSDLLGIPNLSQRATESWGFLWRRYVLKLGGVRPPSVRGRGEFLTLLAYAALSWPYRVFVLVSIVLVLWSSPRYLTLGMVLAVVTGCAWGVYPLLKGAWFLLTSPRLLGRRARAIGLIGGTLAVLLVVLGLVPMPAAGYASGTVEALVNDPIRAGEDGFVDQVLVKPGQNVKKGDPLVKMRNPEIDAEVETARAELAKAQSEADAAAAEAPTKQALARTAVEQAQSRLRHALERQTNLTILASSDGQVVEPATEGLDTLEGRFVRRGTQLGSVVSTDQLIVRCMVPDRERGYIFDSAPGQEASSDVRASVRVRGRSWTKVPVRIVRAAAAGSKTLDRPQLGSDAGGEVMLDPTDPQRRQTLNSQFLVELQPKKQPEGWQPGLRARVRLGIAPRPLLVQGWRWFWQFLDERAR